MRKSGIQIIIPEIRSVLLILGLALLLTLPSCTSVDQEQMQEEYLERKIDEFRAFQHRNCMKEVRKEAKMKADSFFLQLAKQQSYDTMRSPRSIPRPLKPSVTIREDSIKLGPLIREKAAADSTPVPKKTPPDSIE